MYSTYSFFPDNFYLPEPTRPAIRSYWNMLTYSAPGVMSLKRSLIICHEHSIPLPSMTSLPFPPDMHASNLLTRRSSQYNPLHFTSHLIRPRLQLRRVHTLLHWPTNTQPLTLIRLWYKVKMHMIDFLMSQSAVVLEDIIVDSTRGSGDLFGYREDLEEGVVRDVG